MTRRSFLQAAAGVALTSQLLATQEPSRARLYNGITPSAPWPPRRASLPPSPQRPPYLADPPSVIDIDVGRQLFVDDFLIEESSLQRTFHRATYHPASPVLVPATERERHDPYSAATGTPPSSAAMVFSDGVFFDPADGLFKMWYMSGYQQHTALAVSRDGITWSRPQLNVVAGTNIVSAEPRDSSTVWLDLDAAKEAARYKMASFDLRRNRLRLQTSRDGVHWRHAGESGPAGDRSTFFWNPFRRRWVFSLRDDDRVTRRRIRRYVETPEFDARWDAGTPVLWTGADSHDRVSPDVTVQPELYNIDAVAYESVMLGLFTMFRGETPQREKPNDLCLGFSRDGFHWDRTWREPFIAVSDRQGDWNWANVQSAGGCCVVVGDRLHFYVSGRQGVPGTGMPGVCSTGLATLRRDGFASIGDQPAGSSQPRRVTSGPATLTTRPVRFSGRHLFVNADVAGRLAVEVLDREGRLIAPYSADNILPVVGDQTQHAIRWRGADTLERLAGEAVRFRFTLSGARLFAFWVSTSPSGHSNGYVAAGGPGYAGTVDAG